MTKLLIVGAGGHGKVVAEAALSMGKWSDIAFLDAKYPQIKEVLGYPVIGNVNDANEFSRIYQSVAIAIGNNDVRMNVLNKLRGFGFACPSIIHSSACISPTATLGEGVVVLAKAVINAEANLGIGCVVNTGAIVEHDCQISDGVHIGPGVCLGGAVSVGAKCWFGIGACVIQCLTIEKEVTVGAGAVVINNISDTSVTVVGIPAKLI